VTRPHLRHTLTAAAIAAAVSVTACSAAEPSGDPGSKEGKRIAFVGPVAVPVWLQAKEGFESAAKAAGMQPEWTAPNAVDIPGTVQTLQNVINSGVDGIATCALDPKAFAGPLQDAKEKGIPVVLVDCDTEDKSLRAAYVGTIGQTFGAQTADKLVEMTDGEAKIIQMQGQFDAAIQNQIYDGFESVVAQHPGMQVLVREANNSDVQLAVEKLENLFRTHPDATVVYCIEAGCAGAAATVVKERGLVGKVTIVGTDDDKATLDGIREGVVTFSAAQPFRRMGRLAAERLGALLDGQEVEDVTDTGVVFVDKSNVDTYTGD
jgi:ABC-type sugar transport system substrate-binding protein